MQDNNRLCMNCMKDMGESYDTCPYCGFSNDTNQKEGYIPLRTVLKGRFIVGMLKDSNTEGNTYIGWDMVDNLPVFIREFMPDGVCSRSTEDGVSVLAKEGQNEFFESCKHDFIELSKSVADVERAPALLLTVDIFEANGTAFTVTEYVDNISLESFLNKNGNRFSWEQTRALIMPVLASVRQMHNAGILHRGISPKTIIVGRDGKLRLTDICIPEIRSSRGNIKAELFQGYSAVEQYGFDSKITESTDIYALAATIFRMLTGITPPSAKERAVNDNLVIPTEQARSMPNNVLVALANGLQIMPNQRTQNIYDFHGDLVNSPRSAEAEEREEKPEGKGGRGKTIVIAIICTIVILGGLALLLWKLGIFNKKEGPEAFSSQATSSTITSSYSVSTAIPDMVGKTYPEAVNLCGNKFELVVVQKVYSTTYDKGKIVSQSPEANKTVSGNERGDKTTIEVVISLGASSGTVPDVSGQTYAEAFMTLVKAGFSPDNIEEGEKYSADVDGKMVVDTNPIAGTKNISYDSKITIYVNTKEESSSKESSRAASSETSRPETSYSPAPSRLDPSSEASSEASSETSSEPASSGTLED